VLRSTGAYLAASLRPIAALIVPLTLLFFHVAAWLEHQPLHRGEESILTVRVDPSVNLATIGVQAASSPSLELSASPFRSTLQRECSWRLKVLTPDRAAWVELRIGDQTERKRVAAGPGLSHIEPRRYRQDDGRSGLNTQEPPLPPQGVITAIELKYAARVYRMGGVDVGWLGAVFILSLVLALLLKRPLGVEF
jgi:hypothetical protein